MKDLIIGEIQDPKVRKKKSLTESEKQHFGDRLWKNLLPDSAIVGLMNPQSLPNKKCSKKNCDLINIMQELSFYHMGLAVP